MDCLIPLAVKDLKSLPYCVKGIRENLPEVTGVRIVARAEHRAAVEALGLEVGFLSEEDAHATICGADTPRPRGWLLQQLLKLEGGALVQGDRWLVVDADTIFLKPTHFVEEGRSVLSADVHRGEQQLWCRGYGLLYENLLGQPFEHRHCFIAHHMVFDRDLVAQMLGRFKCKPWWRVFDEPSRRFSEYDFYGAFVAQNHPERLKVRKESGSSWLNAPWAWWEDQAATAAMIEAFRQRGWTYVSCHDYVLEDFPMLGPQDVMRFARESGLDGDFESLGLWVQKEGLEGWGKRAFKWFGRATSPLVTFLDYSVLNRKAVTVD